MTIIFVISFKFRAYLLCIFRWFSCMMFVFFFFWIDLKIFVNRHVSDGCALKTAAFFSTNIILKWKTISFSCNMNSVHFRVSPIILLYSFICPKYFCYYIIQKNKSRKQWTKKNDFSIYFLINKSKQFLGPLLSGINSQLTLFLNGVQGGLTDGSPTNNKKRKMIIFYIFFDSF